MDNLPNKRPRRYFSSQEKEMIYNLYNTFLGETPEASYNDIAKTIASSLGIHWMSVYRIVKEKKTAGILKSPRRQKQRKTVISMTDSFTKSALRNIVHTFFTRNEIPTLDKILSVVNNDETMKSMKRSTLHKLLQNMGFKFMKRSRNSLLNDREDLKFWRRNYLQSIKSARESGKKIFYLDETWINEGHTKSMIWVDSTVQNARHAFINGLSTGLKNPSGELFKIQF